MIFNYILLVPDSHHRRFSVSLGYNLLSSSTSLKYLIYFFIIRVLSQIRQGVKPLFTCKVSMDQSIVSQREINVDTESYVTALRASLLTAETALAYATNPEMLKKKCRLCAIITCPGGLLELCSPRTQKKNEDISDCTAKLISSFFYFISAILFSGFYCPFSSHFLLAGFLTQVPGLPQLSCDTLLLPCSYNLKCSDYLELQCLHFSIPL